MKDGRERSEWPAERILYGIGESLAVVIFFAEAILLFVSSAARYGFDHPLFWADELAATLLLWLAMLGAAVAFRRNEHLRLTTILQRFPEPWRSHVEKLRARAAILNAHGFDKVRYRGPGTDLTLGLSERSRWVGGSVENDAGVEFVPNMPTEEVFVSPDWRRAEGSVRTTAPFFIATMGALVEKIGLVRNPHQPFWRESFR